jgi:hypothetical protein
MKGRGSNLLLNTEDPGPLTQKNQKQELPVAAMLVNVSGRNKQTL